MGALKDKGSAGIVSNLVPGLGSLGQMLDKGAEKISEGVANTVEAALTAALQKMLDCIKAVQDQFSEVAKDLLSQKQAEIIQVMNEVINSDTFPNAGDLCRGGTPWTGDQLKGCQKDKVTAYFASVAVKDLASKLLPKVQDCIDKNKAVKSWDAMVDTYNSLVENYNKALTFLGDKVKDTKVEQVTVLTDDMKKKEKESINEFIVTELITALLKRMGAEESKKRSAPESSARKETFQAVFQAPVLKHSHVVICREGR